MSAQKNRTYKLKSAAREMDWLQVVLNGGPPCFALQRDGHFCGRAERWHCFDTHKFIPLENIIG